MEMEILYYDESNKQDIPADAFYPEDGSGRSAAGQQLKRHHTHKIYAFDDVDCMIDAITHNALERWEASRLISWEGLDCIYEDTQQHRYTAECVLILWQNDSKH